MRFWRFRLPLPFPFGYIPKPEGPGGPEGMAGVEPALLCLLDRTIGRLQWALSESNRILAVFSGALNDHTSSEPVSNLSVRYGYTMGYRTWTDGDLLLAVRTSKTLAEVIRKLGLSSKSSGNFQSVQSHLQRLKPDLSHFHRPANVSHGRKRPLNEILTFDSDYANTDHLKHRLIKEGVLKENCYECGISEWWGRKLSLHLDHKDGNRRNNLRGNLRLLCPNCHSLTPTYSRIKQIIPTRKCKCGAQITRKSKLCTVCDAISRRGKNLKIAWPPYADLLRMVSEFGYLGAGKRLGVSDKAVKKHMMAHDRRQSGQA